MVTKWKKKQQQLAQLKLKKDNDSLLVEQVEQPTPASVAVAEEHELEPQKKNEKDAVPWPRVSQAR